MKYTLLSVTALQNYPPHSNALFKIMTFIMKVLIKIMKSILERRYFWADSNLFLDCIVRTARGVEGDTEGVGRRKIKADVDPMVGATCVSWVPCVIDGRLLDTTQPLPGLCLSPLPSIPPPSFVIKLEQISNKK